MKKHKLIKIMASSLIGAGIALGSSVAITSCNNLNDFSDFKINNIPESMVFNSEETYSTGSEYIVLSVSNESEAGGGSVSYQVIAPDNKAELVNGHILKLDLPGMNPALPYTFHVKATETKDGYISKSVTQFTSISFQNASTAKQIDGGNWTCASGTVGVFNFSVVGLSNQVKIGRPLSGFTSCTNLVIPDKVWGNGINGSVKGMLYNVAGMDLNDPWSKADPAVKTEITGSLTFTFATLNSHDQDGVDTYSFSGATGFVGFTGITEFIIDGNNTATRVKCAWYAPSTPLLTTIATVKFINCEHIGTSWRGMVMEAGDWGNGANHGNITNIYFGGLNTNQLMLNWNGSCFIDALASLGGIIHGTNSTPILTYLKSTYAGFANWTASIE